MDPQHILLSWQYRRCDDCPDVTVCFPVGQKPDGSTLWRCDTCHLLAQA